MEKIKYKIFTDGGARGNPGPAAVAFIVIKQDNGKILKKFSKRIGTTTNNVAEYSAVLEALKWATKNLPKESEINFFLDSKLVVNQLNGYYKIKDFKLKKLILQVKTYENEFKKVFYYFLPREKNKETDKLVNICLAGK